MGKNVPAHGQPLACTARPVTFRSRSGTPLARLLQARGDGHGVSRVSKGGLSVSSQALRATLKVLCRPGMLAPDPPAS